jgi:hypothetical protein
MSSVVSSHALEALGEHSLFLCDLFQRLANIVSQSVKLTFNFRQALFHLFVVLDSLVHVASPFFAVRCVLVDFQFVSHSLNFEHPLVAGNRRMYDLLLNLLLVVSFVATHIACKVHVFVNVRICIVVLSVSVHVCEVSVPLEVISKVIVITSVAKALSVFLDNGLSEFEPVLDADLSERSENDADSFSKATLQFVGTDVKFNSKFLEFKNNVLRGSHGVIIFVPATDLVVVDRKQP